MENGKSCQHSDMTCAYGGHHMWLRWVLGILILMCAFWLGFQFGSVRSYTGYGNEYAPYQMMYGYPSMMQQRRYAQPNNYGMMQLQQQPQAQYLPQQGSREDKGQVGAPQPQQYPQ